MKKPKIDMNRDNIIAIVGIIFFVILVLVVRIGGGSDELVKDPDASPSPSPTDGENNSLKPEEIANNYHFTYTVNVDGVKEVIDGEVNGGKAKFSILGNKKEEYIKLSNTYMRVVDGKYEVLEDANIRPYFPYLGKEGISEIQSISLSSNEEDDVYEYEIDVFDLLDKYTVIEYDSFEEFKTDKMVVRYNKKGYIKDIKIDYSNYFTYVNKRTSVFKVTMEFDSYGEIKDFEV